MDKRHKEDIDTERRLRVFLDRCIEERRTFSGKKSDSKDFVIIDRDETTISVRNVDKTEDSIIARQIYDELSKSGYRVFFAEKTLEDKVGTEYEPIIFKALHTSKIFTSVSFNSCWIRLLCALYSG